MPTIQELEQKVRQLEKMILDGELKDKELIAKAEKAIDYASHAYRVDHYGFIWVWDVNKQDYRKTNMRVCTPEIADRSLESRNIADNAIEGRHLQDDVIEGRMIKDKTIDGRSIKNESIGGDQIKDESITGDSIKPGGVDKGKLADDAISERNIQNHSVSKNKLSTELISLIYSAGSHGYHLSDKFGSNEEIGINQKTLTLAFNKLWQKLGDITGESYMGISMVVTPEYFYGNQGCTVHVKATTEDAIGPFEDIDFYVNNQLVRREKDTDYVEFDTEIQDTSSIVCTAQILGMPYGAQKTIHRYDAFWLGAGNAYSDVYNKQAAIVELDKFGRAAKDVTLTSGQHIIIVMGDYMKPGFIRADINGIEIEFTESTFTDNGNTYVVLTSVNTYQAGTVNIDING